MDKTPNKSMDIVPSDREIVENICRNDPGSCAGW